MYSQNEEERVILNYFGETTGVFLDIGANDGVTLSNTRALSEKGWCGVLVEPSPMAFYRLKSNYHDKKGCYYFYPFALGTKNGRVTLYESGELLKSNDVALVSTLLEKETERFNKVVSYNPIEVQCYRWKTFKNRLHTDEFDFISIDIEGLEIEVLEQIDLSKTKLICVETNGSQEKKTKLDAMLPDFKVIYTSAENLIYAR